MNPREHEAWYQTVRGLGGAFARAVEAVLPGVLPWGGFLAVLLRKPDHGKMIGNVMLHL